MYIVTFNGFLKNFYFKTSSVFSSPDAASILPLHVQVTAAQGEASYGTYPDPANEESLQQRPSLRRSSRIAARNAAREEIT